MATIGNFSAVRDGGFAGAGTSRLQSPAQRPSISPGAGNISAGRVFGGGGNAIGNEFRGTGVGTPARGLLSNRSASPMAPYGNAFDFTGAELTSALMSMNKAGLPGAGFFDLMGLQSALQKPQNIAMSEALGAPFAAYQNEPAPSPSLPSGVLGGAFNEPPLTATRQPVATQQQDMGPLSDAAISAALTYQNTPLENDIAYLASRVGPSASPEALALVDPSFVSELAREIRTAEEATGTTARINDMYRSPETQAEIYDRSRQQGFMAAPAGQSWHQAAVAADIARSPVLNYMRANTPSSLNFPFGQEDLVHVQMSNPMMAQTGVTRGSRGAFTTTLADAGSILGGGDMGQMAPTSVANASPSSAPARVAFNQPLAPRTPTPSFIDRLATNVFGIPAYDTGPGLLGGAAKSSEMAAQMLAGAQPQVVEAASAPEAPPAVRPTAEPVSLASLLIDRAISRGEDRRLRNRMYTTVEQMQRDTIGGLLA